MKTRSKRYDVPEGRPLGRPSFYPHKMWTDVKTDKWKAAVFVEKDGENCVDFCVETDIITPAFERAA